ncbi:HypC/HybG/HupF family hydrogenase formation chaperone [Azospirillum sp. ST 5-10]|uniref:HypC/HybG/HupF family hydrogenase formation chaperone n=1 Tax=unclassified Azospirillum TaxID=2630922 RepID=UPI003F4A8387
MCIALPVQIVAVTDPRAPSVAVQGRHGRDEVSAALVAPPGGDASALLGRWAVVHAGFILSLLDEADARSRLAVFAAMDGEDGGTGDLRTGDGDADDDA